MIIYIVVETLSNRGEPFSLRAFAGQIAADRVFNKYVQESNATEADLDLVQALDGTLRYAYADKVPWRSQVRGGGLRGDGEYSIQMVKREIEL